MSASWGSRGERRGPPPAFLAAAAVVGLLVVTAAVGGRWPLEGRRFDFGASAPTTGVTRPPTTAELGEPVAPDRSWDLGLDWLAPYATAVVVAGGLAVVAGVLWWIWVRARTRDVARLRPVATGGDAAVVAEPELPVLRRGVAAAQRFLAGVDRPSDAVIAAWLALEEAAAASGVGRSPAQTPTEFTVAVLERTEADPAATTELLALYHRARFSRHPIGPTEVQAASRCLAALAERWDAVAAGRAPR